MKQKTDLHQSLSALTTAEFDANLPTAIRPLVPIVECAECKRLRAENEALLAIIKFYDRALASIVKYDDSYDSVLNIAGKYAKEKHGIDVAALEDE